MISDRFRIDFRSGFQTIFGQLLGEDFEQFSDQFSDRISDNFRTNFGRGFRIFLGPILGEDFRNFWGVGFPQNWEAKSSPKKPKKSGWLSRVTREAFQHFGLEKSVVERAPRRSQKIKILERFSTKNQGFCRRFCRCFLDQISDLFLKRFLDKNLGFSR